jgi:hypothetical protein
MALSALALTAAAGCSPWFDYAPKGVAPNLSTAGTGHSVGANAQICPAKDLQYLVGQSRTVLHTMRFGSEVRFEEPRQMYSQEFLSSRTRIIIGADGKISRILCG